MPKRKPRLPTSQGPLTAPCPGCGGNVPNNLKPGSGPGKTSKFDNITEVCTLCGRHETYVLARGGRLIAPGREEKA